MPDGPPTRQQDRRWHQRRQEWVTPPEVFRPDRYAVDVVPEAAAKMFVCEHHYSGSFPAARLSVGLFGPGAELVGVAVLSVPMNQHVIPAWTGLEPGEGVELGRFVLAPSVRFNGESWMIARLWPLVTEALDGVRAVLSYADPLERRTDGEVVKPAHYGTIYQASNAIYAGRSRARKLTLAPDGSVVNERALSKIRGRERGWEYAARQLVDAGAPQRWPGESLADWLRRALAHPGFRRVSHPGNHAYVFGLDNSAKRHLTDLHDGGLPYPKPERRAA